MTGPLKTEFTRDVGTTAENFITSHTLKFPDIRDTHTRTVFGTIYSQNIVFSRFVPSISKITAILVGSAPGIIIDVFEVGKVVREDGREETKKTRAGDRETGADFGRKHQ